jgi:restriction system protein
MARRSSFTRTLNTFSRQVARSACEAEAAQKRRLREIERAEREVQRLEREHLKSLAAASKDAQRQYLEARAREVDELNGDLALRLEDLDGVLAATLTVDDHISFESLRLSESFPAFGPPKHLLELGEAPKPEVVKPLSALERLIPGATARLERHKATAAERHATAVREYEATVRQKAEELKRLHHEHEQSRAQHLAGVRSRNQEVADFEAAYGAGEPNAVVDYCAMVLERSQYPDGSPQRYRLAYLPEPKELVVEYELPDVSVVPGVAEYKYVKTRDGVDEKPRKPAEIKAIYQDIVASVVLRTIHELLEADRAGHLLVVTLNGMLDMVDPATGKDLRRCVISVRTTREAFNELNLARITPG